jgi:cation diffusion facilitator family transporter
MPLFNNRKTKVAALSVASNTLLIILKVIAGVMSGSVSIISEAIHSGMDLVASIIAFFSVRTASTPADRDHPYGHGKIENVSGVAEGLLIFVAAGMIIFESVKKLHAPTPIEETTIGIAVMVISAIVNMIVSSMLYRTAREEDSVALEADALHLKTDVYTSLGVALGILLIKVTGITILDPLVAIAVALLIIKESYTLCKNAFGPLLDTKLADAEEQLIQDILQKYENQMVDFHKLRTRKAGQTRYIDFHLTVQANMSVKDAHDLSDQMVAEIKSALPHSHVYIHIEPPKES